MTEIAIDDFPMYMEIGDVEIKQLRGGNGQLDLHTKRCWKIWREYFDQKSNQLYCIEATVEKNIREMQSCTVRNVL